MAKILIVDDHAPNRDLIATLARHAGHDTVEAGDGAEALTVAKAERPQLVICDILMPTMDGYEFVRRLRADPEIAATQVMFYTANYREREARALATSLGVSHILVKPCGPEEVLSAIAQALGRSSAPPPQIDNEAVETEHRLLLIKKLAEKAAELQRANQRLAVLTELNLQLSSAPDSSALLTKVCHGARELTGARYAIACIQAKNNGQEIYFHGAGLAPDDSQRLICPEIQAGIFGRVMEEGKSRRFTNPSGHAEAIGFPSGYPPAHAGVVVPVLSPRAVYGWVCLFEKVGATEFSDEDEWLSGAHAAQVGRIYENRSLFDQLQHRASELSTEVQTRQRTEQALVRISRARRVMAACNRVLVRATDERQLLADMCRTIVVEAGDYDLAWLGLVHHDVAKTIETAACEGDRENYFGRARLSWGDNDYGRGPIGRSVRTGKVQTERYLTPKSNMPKWYESVVRAGRRAISALPLICGDETLGALCIVSTDAAAFDAAEIDLLSELADDIAFGIHTLRARERQRQTDITLRKSENRFQATFEQSAVGIAHLGFDGRFLRVNDKMCALLGYQRDAFLTRTLVDVTHPDDRAAIGNLLDLLKAGKLASNTFNREQRYICRNGCYFWGDTTAAAVQSVPDEDHYVILVLQDVTDRKRYEAELEHQATHDALTGLANRYLLTDRMEQAILFAQRSGHGVAVILLDLDRFKLINDGIGHATGDALLQVVAQRLSETVRRSDTVARLGGDEFMIIMSEVSGEDDAMPMVQTLLEVVAQPITLAEKGTVVTASLGVALYPRDGDNAAILFKNADIAMYRAKDLGRNSFQFYAPDMNSRMSERLEMERGLRRALQENQFELHYQPKVELKSGALIGAEALIRWRHPTNGLISPTQFIPLAEETGLISPIGAWVIATACEQIQAWRDAGLPEITVAVNVSARQFQQDDLASVVSQCLQRTGIPAGSLVIEVTESAVMSNPEKAKDTLTRLKEIGVCVSLDDFGTGYSSLNYLKRFPIDSLKIDQSFVRDIPADAENAAIAVLVISLAHSLRLSVIAEGVETETQLTFLRRQGCDEIQGYYFSRPLMPEAFAGLLREGRRLSLAPLS
jgi:diguanylate cyclase (GGDEF)-like protein/PAS domain S-box-containing protein